MSRKELHPAQILMNVLVSCQPGGSGEKGALLQALQVVEHSVSAVQVVQSLRAWGSANRRAEDLRVVIPDPSILLGRLLKMVGGLLA